MTSPTSVSEGMALCEAQGCNKTLSRFSLTHDTSQRLLLPGSLRTGHMIAAVELL